MKKQIAAANWKMNLDLKSAEQLLDDLLLEDFSNQEHHEAIFAVPFPYLDMAIKKVKGRKGFFVAAQNCHHKATGAFTGEVSVEMISSMGIRYCIVGHSERREYNHETNQMLAEKVDLCLANEIAPIFCCGEPLSVREEGAQNEFVKIQLMDSIFHLPKTAVSSLVIAYEPIWAIGTGKTASTAQAQEMHKHLRSLLADKYGEEVAGTIPILYGGSVKAANAKELFSSPDVDGGLVGRASLVASEFKEIIGALD